LFDLKNSDLPQLNKRFPRMLHFEAIILLIARI